MRPPAYPPVLLERKARQIKKGLDPEKGRMYEVRTVFSGTDRQYVLVSPKLVKSTC